MLRIVCCFAIAMVIAIVGVAALSRTREPSPALAATAQTFTNSGGPANGLDVDYEDSTFVRWVFPDFNDIEILSSPAACPIPTITRDTPVYLYSYIGVGSTPTLSNLRVDVYHQRIHARWSASCIGSGDDVVVSMQPSVTATFVQTGVMEPSATASPLPTSTPVLDRISLDCDTTTPGASRTTAPSHPIECPSMSMSC